MQLQDQQFWLTVTRGVEDRLGIEVTLLSSTLRIDEVNDGLLSAWNSANPALMAEAFAHILQVNDIRGSGKELLDELIHV